MAESVGHTDDRGPAEMVPAKPMILAVDDDLEALRRLIRELEQRYDADYEVRCHRTPERALETLQEAGGWPWCSPTRRCPRWGAPTSWTGCGACIPEAKRGLLVHWGDWARPERAGGMLAGMAESRFDYYVLKPTRPGEEQFHRIVSEFLHEWARSRSPEESEITIVGGEWAPRTHDLRSFLARNGVPHVFVEDDCVRGVELLEQVGLDRRDGPIAIVRDGPVLADPTNVELARAFGVTTELGRRARLRRDRRRRGPRRAGRGGLRGVGGPQHPRHRARGDRRAGRLELVDPQLSRLLARHLRRRAVPARLPAGVGVRGLVPDGARGLRPAR